MNNPEYLVILFSAFVIGITLSNWRYGLLAVIPIGVLQDVLRKLTPGVPAYYILWSAALFALVVGTALSTSSLRVRLLWLDDQRLKKAFNLFFLVILLQVGNALIRWGNPAVPVFGLVFYFGPFVALLAVIVFAQHPVWIQRFIRVYLCVMVPACLTVYLSKWFQGSVPIFKELGEFTGQRLMIYDVGSVLYSYSGLFRVGEIAAFHAATCAALLTILILKKNQLTGARVLYSILVALLIGAIILTGRRKMLMVLSIFWVVQMFLLAYPRYGMSRFTLSLLFLGLIISAGIGMFDQGESSLYLQRGKTVFSSVQGRAETAFSLFTSALSRSDGIGLGAGIASQGARYAGINNSRAVGGSSESGIGLLAVELGIPGILVIGWLLYCMGTFLWRKLQFIAHVHQELYLYSASFSALLIANLAAFSVATQLYGDFFVLIILGAIGGMLYALIYHAVFLKYQVLQKRAGAQELKAGGMTPVTS